MSNDRQSLSRRAGLLRLREQPRRHTPLYRLWLNKTFRKLLAGGVILFVIWLLLLTTTLPADGRHVLLFFHQRCDLLLKLLDGCLFFVCFWKDILVGKTLQGQCG